MQRSGYLLTVSALVGLAAALVPSAGRADKAAVTPVYPDFAKTSGKPAPGQVSFVAGHQKNGVQFMVKDSKKYAATGGWGYAQFDDGKPADDSVMKACFPCHELIKARDYVFTRYAP